MCGIAGGLDLSPDALGEMLEKLHHRGPDGQGHFQGQRFSLGMTRLAILDPDHGQQPFTGAKRRIQAVCNGEIYNWRELREELCLAGHRFQTECDCEIIPAAYLEWGEEMVKRFNGMFALAVLDQDASSLFLARDRCGQKPLYLTTQGPLRFASEIKALGVPLVPDASQLRNWLSLRYVPEPQTLFQKIETLPAAHHLTIKHDGSRTLKRYWIPPTGEQPGSLDELDRLTRSSVELALQADVPIAAYLSAGVDSSLLLHYIKELDGDVTTVSLGFGAGSDETPEALAFAKSMDLPHHPVHLTPESLSNLPRVIHQMDRPIGDALILAFDQLASHTRSLGCKVALGGEGPDEHFAGYSFQSVYLQALRLGPTGRSLAAASIKRLPLPLLNRLAKFPAELDHQGRSKIARYFSDFTKADAFQRLTGLHQLFDSPEEIMTSRENPAPPAQLEGLLQSQYSSWLPDWSLIRQDKNTMAHSLEYRAPFLDHRIINFALHQPLRPDKKMWRELAARHLSPEITRRTKQPFYLPLEHPSWQKPLIAMGHDILTREAVEKWHWLSYDAISPLKTATNFLPLKKLASLIILQLWLDQF